MLTKTFLKLLKLENNVPHEDKNNGCYFQNEHAALQEYCVRGKNGLLFPVVSNAKKQFNL